MKTRDYVLIFILALAVLAGEAALLPVPGYMDAEYYYAGGIQLATGKGFQEPYLWNYLDDPGGLPHPAFTYWMPLTSLLAALGMFLTARTDFLSARFAFLLLAALVPPLTAYLSWRLTHSRLAAWLAAGMAAFSGFYAAYMGLTDTFAVYMLLGSLFLLLAVAKKPAPFPRYVLLGLVAGLMHLARADGLAWLACAGLWALVELKPVRWPAVRILRSVWPPWAALLVGYLAVMAAWYLRNLGLYGWLFSPASGRALWLADYNQMFAYPASQLGLQSWLSAGFSQLAGARLEALWLNLQTTLAVQGSIFLLPLMLVGLWSLRRLPIVQLGAAMWAVTFLLMTLVFPLAGSRGGFFHSGAAVQPLLWALAAKGFLAAIDWGVRRRNWKFERASQGFGGILVALCLGLSLALLLPQALSNGGAPSAWASSASVYQAVGSYLSSTGAPPDAVVAVNNPPGFYLATGHPAIVTPDGGLAAFFAAAGKFHASYLVVEQNAVTGLMDLYQNPRSQPGLKYLQTVDGAVVYQMGGN